jgi:60S ribosomal subunit assembly/export protein LOC1
MAPNRGERSRSSNLSSKNSKSPLKPIGGSKSKIAKSHAKKAPPSKQLKTRPGAGVARKKRKIYTEAELGLPKLNMITPVGVQKPSGKKKGKVFVDDAVSPHRLRSFRRLLRSLC